MLDQFSATIEKLYAAAAGTCAWREALIAVEDFTRSAGAVIDLIPKSSPGAPRTLAGSFTDENCAEYARDYQAICPRIRFALSNPGIGAQFDYLFITEAEMDRDPVYEWLGKHGLRYYLGGRVADTPNYLAVTSLQRTRRQGHVNSSDIDLFEVLKPHLARAASLADQLGTLRAYRHFSSSMLEALPQAVFALDCMGTLLFANARGREMLCAADGLLLDSGLLRTASADDEVELNAMIRGAVNPIQMISGRGSWIRVSRPSGRLPYAVFVAPLSVADEELLAAEAKVLVLVHDTAQQRCADAAMLTSLYALTDTEARLASALSGGHSLESAAATLGMQPATARSHLKHVFRKLGVNRQQDLVRLLTSLSNVTPLV